MHGAPRWCGNVMRMNEFVRRMSEGRIKVGRGEEKLRESPYVKWIIRVSEYWSKNWK